MLIQAFLRRLVVVRRHQESAIRAGPHGVPGALNGLCGAVRTGAGDDRDPSVHLLDHQLYDPVVLFMAQRGGLSRGSTRHNPVRSIFNMKFHQRADALFVELFVAERSDHRDIRTLKHEKTSFSFRLCGKKECHTPFSYRARLTCVSIANRGFDSISLW